MRRCPAKLARLLLIIRRRRACLQLVRGAMMVGRRHLPLREPSAGGGVTLYALLAFPDAAFLRQSTTRSAVLHAASVMHC